MAYNGLRVADSDMHVLEPADLWQRYIDPRFSHAAPVGLDEIPRDMRLRIKFLGLSRQSRLSLDRPNRE